MGLTREGREQKVLIRELGSLRGRHRREWGREKLTLVGKAQRKADLDWKSAKQS